MRSQCVSTPSIARGPSGSRCLNIEDIRRIEQLCTVAQDHSLPLNWMLTIRVPTNLCDAQGKRYAHNVTRVLFQALKRRGSPSIAVTIYERKKNKQELHAHILVHIPSRCTDLIDKRLDPPALHVRRTDDRAVTYVTKERWARPAGRGYFYEQGDYIPGPRVSFTKDATALLRGDTLSILWRVSAGSSPKNARRLSPTTLRSKLRATRIRYELTQKAFYGLIGVSRAHGANVEAGRCRLSRTAMQMALRVMRELRQSKTRNSRGRSVAA